MFCRCWFVSFVMRMTRHQETNHLICSNEDTKKCRDANSFLRMALEFPPYGTTVSSVWHYSFLPMKLYFPTYETLVSYL